MKALILILSLILFAGEKSQACKGLQEPEMQDVVTAAEELKEFVSDDANFVSIKNMSSEDQKNTNAQGAMQPINFAEKKHLVDQFALGDLIVESNVKGGTVNIQGSAYKIGKSCIVTAAHVLYQSTNQEMSEGNKAEYNGKIKFVRGSGSEKREIYASVFFQMTKKDDYRIVDGERHFKGNSDIVVLKLDNYQDNFYKTIKVLSPEQLLKNVDPKVGRKVTCMGSPSHMTQKTYGTCNGADFKWKQENARIFSQDISSDRKGIKTNAAFTSGMSGGACLLDNDIDHIVGLAINGYETNKSGVSEMPNINIDSTDTTAKNIRHMATFSQLDQRMNAELGYGIKDLEKFCK